MAYMTVVCCRTIGLCKSNIEVLPYAEEMNSNRVTGFAARVWAQNMYRIKFVACV